MSKAKRQSFDAFLSHDPVDNALARAVIDRFLADGLTVFSPYLSDPEPLSPSAEVVRRELRDSFSFVILLTPTYLKSEYLPFLLGGANALGSPVFVLTSGVEPAGEPDYLRKYPKGDLWDGLPRIANDIRHLSLPLGEREYESLREVYRQVGVPVDVLNSDPTTRDALASKFRTAAGRQLPAVRLLRELTRLRKSGRLPRLPHPARG